MKDTIDAKQFLIDNFQLRTENSRIDSKYLCVVCSNKLPSYMRGKYYKWDEDNICLGSFLKSEAPDLFSYVSYSMVKLEQYIKESQKETLFNNLYQFVKISACFCRPDYVCNRCDLIKQYNKLVTKKV